MPRIFRLVAGTAFAFLMFIQMSCSDAGVAVQSDPLPPPPGQDVSFAQQIQPIFNANGCVGCHGGSGGLFLTQGQSFVNLVNVTAQAGCTTLKRVLPGNADQSVLYIRVSANSADTQCGPDSRMPKGGARLSQASIDLVKNWINEGAKNN